VIAMIATLDQLDGVGICQSELDEGGGDVRKQALCLATALRCGEQLAAAITIIADCLAVGCRINKSQKSPHTYQSCWTSQKLS